MMTLLLTETDSSRDASDDQSCIDILAIKLVAICRWEQPETAVRRIDLLHTELTLDDKPRVRHGFANSCSRGLSAMRKTCQDHVGRVDLENASAGKRDGTTHVVVIM